MSEEFRRILVIRGGALGDFILTLPVPAALRARFPKAHIEVMGYPRLAVLAVGSRYADACSRVDSASIAPFFVSDADLPEDQAEHFSRFDLILAFWRDADGAFERNLRRCARGRVLFLDPMPPDGGKHAAEHLARPLAELNIAAVECVPRVNPADKDKRAARTFLRENSISENGKILAVHPGSGGRSKTWPAERYADVVEYFSSAEDVSIVLISGPADEWAKRELFERLSTSRPVVADGLPLPILAALMECCACYVGNDSGVTHLAAAVGVPVVAVFGPTDPAIWGPRGERVHVIRGECELSPCPDERRRDCRDRKCLREISASRVIEALLSVLK